MAAVLGRLALNALIGPYTIPFVTFFPAVLFSAWFGGFLAGVFATVLSCLAGSYFFMEPAGSLFPDNATDEVALAILLW